MSERSFVSWWDDCANVSTEAPTGFHFSSRLVVMVVESLSATDWIPVVSSRETLSATDDSIPSRRVLTSWVIS